jgi:hypothetical protein
MDEQHRHEGRNDEGKHDASEPAGGDDRDRRDDLARRRSARDTSNDAARDGARDGARDDARDDARALTARERSERWPIG